MLQVSSFRLFLDKAGRKRFCWGVFIEAGNFALQACNVREKGTHLRKLLGNLEILEYPFFFEHFQKSICRGTFSLVLEQH